LGVVKGMVRVSNLLLTIVEWEGGLIFIHKTKPQIGWDFIIYKSKLQIGSSAIAEFSGNYKTQKLKDYKQPHKITLPDVL